MITNMVSLTPRTLIAGAKGGAIPSIILALIAGIILTYIIVALFSQFPEMGMPEILYAYTPKWFAVPTLLFLSAAWFMAGLVTLTTYVFIITRFLTPEMSILLVIASFILVITYGILMNLRNILNLLEFICILSLPLILFVQLKGYLSNKLDWVYVQIAIMHANHLPEYRPFTTSLFIVLGAANLVIYNRFFKDLKKPSGKSMILLTVICTYTLFTTYFLPIVYGGFDSLSNVLYPWILTSDSMRMKFGIIERVVFIFIGAFLAIAVGSIVLQWNVSLQLLKSVFYFKQFRYKKINLTIPLFIVLFWVITVYFITTININDLFNVVYFYDGLLPVLIFLLIVGLLLAKRGAKSK